MRRDAHALLWDARTAVLKIQRFTADIDLEQYLEDELLQSGVERQFEIIGESLNRLSRLDPATADQITDLPRIVAFRNVLIHGYAQVDPLVVWDVVRTRTTPLRDSIDMLLGEDHTASGAP